MPQHDEGFFSAKDNLRLFWESDVPEDPKAHVAIVHGYGDHCGRYRGIIDHLVREGFAAHGFDYRGHGQSGGRRGHCDRFSEYLDDLEVFWQRVRGAAGDKKIFILGHSHGALMVIHWLARSPEGASGAILSAPYLELAMDPPKLKVWGAQLLGKIIPWLPVSTGITSEQLTRDPEQQRLVDRDPLYNRHATPCWFNESLAAQREALALAPTLRLPIFMFIGSADPIASPSAARQFFDALGSTDKTFKEYPDRVHEPLNDLGREEVWSDISRWISEHL